MEKKEIHILFLSTLNFAVNPRLFKEVKLAAQNGYKATVILFNLENWSNELDSIREKELQGVEIFYLQATKKDFFGWAWSSMFAKVFSSFSSSNLNINSIAHNKRSWTLLRNLKSVENKPFSLVVAHNLGALYPAYVYAEKWKIPFGFDVEDFHPGELVKDKNASLEKQRRVYLMKKLLPKAAYISYASPLIAEETNKLLPKIKNQLRCTILNSFLSAEFKAPKTKNSDKVRFVWFSQNITSGRGLELFIPALASFKDKAELTLIGNLVPEFASFIKDFSGFIKVKEAMNQVALHSYLNNFDVGIAGEVSNIDLNKELAISNKILAYKQAGLFILATNTQAQMAFIKKLPEEGMLVQQNRDAIKEAIVGIIETKGDLRRRVKERFHSGLQLSWENESSKLYRVWKQVVEN